MSLLFFSAWRSTARPGRARLGGARQGKHSAFPKGSAAVCMARLGGVGSGVVWHGRARQGKALQAHCISSRGCSSLQGRVMRGWAKPGEAVLGAAWRGRVMQGAARTGKALQALCTFLRGCSRLHGKVMLRTAFLGKARRGSVWQGRHGRGKARFGEANILRFPAMGSAAVCQEWLGEAWGGKAGSGYAGHGAAWRRRAWINFKNQPLTHE